MIFAEIIRLVIDQGLLIFGLSLIAMGFLVAVQFRHFTSTLNVLLALVAGLGLMAVVLWSTDVTTINMYNMAIFAAVVGVGIDSAIHLGARWMELKGDANRLARTMESLGGAVTACAMTTVAGYIGIVFSHHPGLRSIGLLAVVGLLSCWLVALTAFPLYLHRGLASASER